MVASAPKPPLGQRLKTLLVEYGSYAVWVYFGLFAVVLVGFVLAIQLGVRVESTAGVAGTWGAAYLATKLTQPLRIIATLALTPAVARLARKRRAPEAPGNDRPA